MQLVAYQSLNLVHLRESQLEVSDTDPVVLGLCNLLSSVVDGVELSNLVREADVLEDFPDLVSASWSSEFSLRNAYLVDDRWEQ